MQQVMIARLVFEKLARDDQKSEGRMSSNELLQKYFSVY